MSVRTKSRRSAFTLIELLVVIAIIVLLMALLLPAIQKVREAANKMLCASNIRQIGIAAHNYHNDWAKLPPGTLGSANNNPLPFFEVGASYTGMLTILLPYMEADNIYKQVNPDSLRPNFPQSFFWWDDPRPAPDGSGLPYNFYLSNSRMKMFECPSDTVTQDPATGCGIGLIQYPGVAYPTPGAQFVSIAYFLPPFNTYPKGRTNYVGVAGANGELAGFSTSDRDLTGNPIDLRRFVGIFGTRTLTTLGQLTVQDGTSNTLMIGEGLGGAGIGPRDFVYSWFGCGNLGVKFGLGRGNGTPGTTEAFTGSSWTRFSARHAAGVQFAFGDCHVATVKFGDTRARSRPHGSGPCSTDYWLLLQMAGRNDGLNDDRADLLE